MKWGRYQFIFRLNCCDFWKQVGGTKDILLNVRILCATNQPLENLVEQNRFRADLYYRLNVLTVNVPSLKERLDDIPLLVNNFVTMQGFHKEFDDSAIELLTSYDWPGNIRELKNLVERTCILVPKKVITADDLSFLKVNKKAEPGNESVAPSPTISSDTTALSLKEMERKHIINVLSMVNGHKGKAAKLLEINPKTLYMKMKAYNIITTYE
jgi:DNA-binding NtrC family response regulator